MEYKLDLANSKITNDEIWMKYHNYDKDSFKYPEEFIYDFLYDSNKDNSQQKSINYYGFKITYNELFKKIDTCLVSLLKMGVKENDVVSVCMPTTPEAIIAYYAINKLGAISNFIDVRKDEKFISYCIKSSGSKYLLALDSTIEKINNIIDSTDIKKAVYISPIESFSKPFKTFIEFGQKMNGTAAKIPENSGYINWSQFIKEGANYKLSNLPKYYHDRPAIIEYSSGSTGIPKQILFSNDTINDRVYQYMNNEMQHKVGDKYLDIIPIFIAFGAVVGIHLPLCMGMENVVIPAYDEKNVLSLLKKNNPQHFTLTPSSYNYLIHDKEFEKLNLKDSMTLACGGDGMNPEENKIYDDELLKRGCKFNITSGYGASEIGAPFCTEKSGVYKYGSVGIPLPGNTIAILDHETKKPLDYNQVGDICMIVKDPMIDYNNNPELTKAVLTKLSDGRTAVILGDCGYVDNDGFLFVKGRWENAIVNNDGKLVWPVDIENSLYKLDFIKACAVSKNANNEKGAASITVVMNDSTKLKEYEVKQNILNKVNLEFPDIDFDVNIEDHLLLTSSGKIDRKGLKEKTKEKILIRKNA